MHTQNKIPLQIIATFAGNIGSQRYKFIPLLLHQLKGNQKGCVRSLIIKKIAGHPAS